MQVPDGRPDDRERDLRNVQHFERELARKGEWQRSERVVLAAAQVVGRRRDADVVEAVVVEGRGAVAHHHRLDDVVAVLGVAHRGVRHLRPAMTVDALALVDEDVQPLELLVSELARTLTPHPLVERAVVGDERRLVQHDRHAVEEGEVCLAHREGVRVAGRLVALHPAVADSELVALRPVELRIRHGDAGLGVPVHGLEGPLDELLVGDVYLALAVGQASQQAVFRMHVLALQYVAAEHLATDQRHDAEVVAAVAERHLEVTQRRSHRLGRKAGVLHLHRLDHDGCALALENARPLVLLAERVLPVEPVVGASVPEVGEVEHRVDRRRRVPRLDAPRVGAVDVEDVVRNHGTAVYERAAVHTVEPVKDDALRRGDVVAVPRRGGHDAVAACDVVAGADILDERKVGSLQLVVRSADLEPAVRSVRRLPVALDVAVAGVLHAQQVRIQLVLRSRVRAGLEVAGHAGLDAVGADRHVVEKRLAQLACGFHVGDPLVQIRGQGHPLALDDRPQRLEAVGSGIVRRDDREYGVRVCDRNEHMPERERPCASCGGSYPPIP